MEMENMWLYGWLWKFLATKSYHEDIDKENYENLYKYTSI